MYFQCQKGLFLLGESSRFLHSPPWMKCSKRYCWSKGNNPMILRRICCRMNQKLWNFWIDLGSLSSHQRHMHRWFYCSSMSEGRMGWDFRQVMEMISQPILQSLWSYPKPHIRPEWTIWTYDLRFRLRALSHKFLNDRLNNRFDSESCY
jgi:hypothetical protein